MMKCPECGCRFREQEGKVEDESPEHEMSESPEEEGGESDEEYESGEGEVVVKKVNVSDNKEELIKKKLMELGKLMASIK